MGRSFGRRPRNGAPVFVTGLTARPICLNDKGPDTRSVFRLHPPKGAAPRTDRLASSMGKGPPEGDPFLMAAYDRPQNVIFTPTMNVCDSTLRSPDRVGRISGTNPLLYMYSAPSLICGAGSISNPRIT